MIRGAGMEAVTGAYETPLLVTVMDGEGWYDALETPDTSSYTGDAEGAEVMG
jgi:hypothetical protein